MIDNVNNLMNVLAQYLPLDISLMNRMFLVKTIIAGFFAGFLFSYLLNFLVKKSIMKIQKMWKERKRDKRLAAKKIPGSTFIGEVTQYLSNLNVAVVRIKKKKLKKGDAVLITGNKTKVNCTVDSMQIDGNNVEFVGKGKEAGMLVPKEVKVGDLIYRCK
jgi:translation initiation factor IF-2